MKKVLTLTLILGSFGMMHAQKTITSAKMTFEYQADAAVKGDINLPLAISGYTTEGDKSDETVKGDAKLPLAVAGYSVEGDKNDETVKGDAKLPLAEAGYEAEATTKVNNFDLPNYYDAKVTLNDFDVYPTIAHDVVHLTSNVEGVVRFVVYSLTGEIKKNARFEGSYDLDVTGYAHGTYVVRIGRAGEAVNFKFIR